MGSSSARSQRRCLLLFWLGLLLLPAGDSRGEEPSDATLDEVGRLIRANRSAEALVHLERLHAESPLDQVIARRLARLRSHNDDLAGAILLYDQLLEETPADLELEIERARVLAWMGRTGESIASMIAVTSREPAAVEAWAVLADARLWSGDLGGAREALIEGLEETPGAAPLHARLARLDYKLGDVGGARRHMSRALALDPKVEGGLDPALFSPWVVESNATYEDLSDREPWRTFSVDASFRPAGFWSGELGVERIERYGKEEYSLRGLVRRVLSEKLVLAAGTQVAPGAELVPRWGGQLSVEWRPRHDWRMETSARGLRFDAGSSAVVQVGTTHSLGDVWELRYRIFWARDVAENHDLTHAVRLLRVLSPRSTIDLEVFRGSDVELISNTADALALTTTGFNAGSRLYLSSSWGVRIRAGYADRRGTYSSRSLGLGIIRHL